MTTSNPNFFIIGAIKSGTTSLAWWLLQHRQVYLPGLAELNFFADDIQWRSRPPIESLEQYMTLFSGADRYKAVGEKSVMYLYSKRSPALINRHFPKSKFICILRNPIDVMWSLFKYNLLNLEEDVTDFSEALRREPDRRKLRASAGPGGSILDDLFYRQITAFDEQIENWIKIVGRDRMFIILFEDIVSQPSWTMHNIEAFLEIDHESQIEFTRQNQGSAVFSHRLRRLRYFNLFVKMAWENFMPKAGRTLVKSALRAHSQGGGGGVDRMPPGVRLELSREYRPRINRLAELIGRDLTHWVREPYLIDP